MILEQWKLQVVTWVKHFESTQTDSTNCWQFSLNFRPNTSKPAEVTSKRVGFVILPVKIWSSSHKDLHLYSNQITHTKSGAVDIISSDFSRYIGHGTDRRFANATLPIVAAFCSRWNGTLMEFFESPFQILDRSYIIKLVAGANELPLSLFCPTRKTKAMCIRTTTTTKRHVIVTPTFRQITSYICFVCCFHRRPHHHQQHRHPCFGCWRSSKLL